MNKIYGGKSYWNTQISNTMYSSVFNYYTQEAIDEFYEQIKKNIFYNGNYK